MERDIEYDYWWASIEGAFQCPLCSVAMQAGSAKRLYEMDAENLASLKGITKEHAECIVRKREKWDLKGEYEKCIKSGIRFIPHYAREYPVRLRRISGHPFAIFVIGKLPDDNKRSVALIGARNCSEYGRHMAYELGSELALNGIAVISGMAYGIDSISQKAAVEADGYSCGVLGCGVDICYPSSNRELYERLKITGGLVSEYPPGTSPRPALFPPRNRIIAALSDLVVVVEARKKSGTGITVEMALDQGKDIAVVPGRVTDPLSEGCIDLWKQGAIPVGNAEDIIEILRPLYPEDEDICQNDGYGDRNGSSQTAVIDDPLQKKIYDFLAYDPVDTETICERLGLDIFDAIEALTVLRISGHIRELSKDCYVKE
ncbi:MAG: DNA-processing protein DprA [Lachnospiraceae bacterium]|nr:DNA-processing protein DprA [Lachnospiraceae bacterium]